METAVGVVGLGHMGGNVALRLLGAGYPVVGESRSREPAQHLVDAGMDWRDTPRQVAEAADVVITSLPNDRVIEEVAVGSDGLLAGLAPGKVWVDMSTISPRTSRGLADRVRARRAAFLDAPVSGSVPQVQSGTLTIMVGGDEDAYRRVEPVLRELGTPTRVGANGLGLVLKLAVNISLAAQMVAFAEGLQLATRSGVDPQIALDVMTSSPIGSPMLKARAGIVLDPPEEAWFDLRLMQKDIVLALDAGQRLGLPMDAAELADTVLEHARALGYGSRDLAVLYRALEQLTPERQPAA